MAAIAQPRPPAQLQWMQSHPQNQATYKSIPSVITVTCPTCFSERPSPVWAPRARARSAVWSAWCGDPSQIPSSNTTAPFFDDTHKLLIRLSRIQTWTRWIFPSRKRDGKPQWVALQDRYRSIDDRNNVGSNRSLLVALQWVELVLRPADQLPQLFDAWTHQLEAGRRCKNTNKKRQAEGADQKEEGFSTEDYTKRYSTAGQDGV